LGVDSVLIFEDDVEFSDDFEQQLQVTLDTLPADWHMLYLGAIQLEDPQPINLGLQRISRAYSTYAYAINHRLFDAFIALNEYADQPLDVNQFELQQNYNCYCVHPYQAWVEVGYSDAQEKNENHWYLRESLVLFGQTANRLLANTCVVIICEPAPTVCALENLYFFLDYYQQQFQGYLSIRVVEQGCSSALDPMRLPDNVDTLILPVGIQPLFQQISFQQALAKIDETFDYLVVSSNHLYLEAMDFRANLMMCQRYEGTLGFEVLTRLDADQSACLKNNGHARTLDLSANIKVNTDQQNDSCFYFINRKALGTLWMNDQLGRDTQSKMFHPPNHALRLFY
jgi:GR25 family glycosyltransferase involved in LPS biosynthesis